MASRGCPRGYFTSLPEIIALPALVKAAGELVGLSRVLKLLLAPYGFFSPQKPAGSPASCNGTCHFFHGQHKYEEASGGGGDRAVASQCWVQVPTSGYGREKDMAG